MRDDLDDDPILVQLAAARPEPPATLVLGVLARIRARRRRVPMAIGVTVAALAALVVLLPLPHDERPIEIVIGPAPGAPRDAGAPDAPRDDLAWTDLHVLLGKIIVAHGDEILRCTPVKGSGVRMRIDRNAARLSGSNDCVTRVVGAIAVPPLPPGIDELELEIPLSYDALDRAKLGIWNDLSTTAEVILAPFDDVLGTCLPARFSTIHVAVAGTHLGGGCKTNDGPQRSAEERADCATYERCLTQAFGKATVKLPWPVTNATLSRAVPLRHVLARMSRGICYGTCPVYQVTVFTDGGVEYRGDEHVKKRGKATAKLSADELAALRAAFADAKFFDRPDKSLCATDLSEVSVFFDDGKRTKTTTRTSCGSADDAALQKLEHQIDAIVKTDRWVH